MSSSLVSTYSVTFVDDAVLRGMITLAAVSPNLSSLQSGILGLSRQTRKPTNYRVDNLQPIRFMGVSS